VQQRKQPRNRRLRLFQRLLSPVEPPSGPVSPSFISARAGIAVSRCSRSSICCSFAANRWASVDDQSYDSGSELPSHMLSAHSIRFADVCLNREWSLFAIVINLFAQGQDCAVVVLVRTLNGQTQVVGSEMRCYPRSRAKRSSSVSLRFERFPEAGKRPN
jgi:hypothetical protein